MAYMISHIHVFPTFLLLVNYFEENEDVEKVQKELAAFSVNPFGLTMETVPSLQKYFDSLNSSMSQFEKIVSSRVASSSSLINPGPNAV